MLDEPENVRRDWRIPDELWERIHPLLPPRKPHPLGCHRPRVNDRQAMDAIFFVLRTGCQWNALQDTGLCSSSSAHRRLQERAAAGVFLAFWEQGLAIYEALQGIDWEWLAMDGAMTKAPLGGGKRSARIRPTVGRSAPNGACSPTATACLSASPWRAPIGMTSRWSMRHSPVSQSSAQCPLPRSHRGCVWTKSGCKPSTKRSRPRGNGRRPLSSRRNMPNGQESRGRMRKASDAVAYASLGTSGWPRPICSISAQRWPSTWSGWASGGGVRPRRKPAVRPLPLCGWSPHNVTSQMNSPLGSGHSLHQWGMRPTRLLHNPTFIDTLGVLSSPCATSPPLQSDPSPLLWPEFAVARYTDQ
jgi:Putative transposase of IS4/5 family (DUF4096)